MKTRNNGMGDEASQLLEYALVDMELHPSQAMTALFRAGCKAIELYMNCSEELAFQAAATIINDVRLAQFMKDNKP